MRFSFPGVRVTGVKYCISKNPPRHHKDQINESFYMCDETVEAFFALSMYYSIIWHSFCGIGPIMDIFLDGW